MDENKLRAIVKEVVGEAVHPIKEQLDGVVRRLDANTAAIVELESTVNGYADMYKINDSNIRRIPPEYQLEPL